MAQEHQYRAKVEWSGGWQGGVFDYASYSRQFTAQLDGKPDLIGSADPSFKGDPTRCNPEELLLISLSACHMLSFLAECARAGITVLSYADDAQGRMAIRDGRMRFVEVVLHPQVAIASDNADPSAAQSRLEQSSALHARAHDICFIANSVDFDVRNEPTIVFAGGCQAAKETGDFQDQFGSTMTDEVDVARHLPVLPSLESHC